MFSDVVALHDMRRFLERRSHAKSAARVMASEKHKRGGAHGTEQGDVFICHERLTILEDRKASLAISDKTSDNHRSHVFNGQDGRSYVTLNHRLFSVSLY